MSDQSQSLLPSNIMRPFGLRVPNEDGLSATNLMPLRFDAPPVPARSVMCSLLLGRERHWSWYGDTNPKPHAPQRAWTPRRETEVANSVHLWLRLRLKRPYSPLWSREGVVASASLRRTHTPPGLPSLP